MYLQFNYEPFIWMFSKKKIYFKIKKIGHATLKVNCKTVTWVVKVFKVVGYWNFQERI